MKISGLRLGMVYKKVYRAKDEDLHEIVEITEDNLGDYKRAVSYTHLTLPTKRIV